MADAWSRTTASWNTRCRLVTRHTLPNDTVKRSASRLLEGQLPEQPVSGPCHKGPPVCSLLAHGETTAAWCSGPRCLAVLMTRTTKEGPGRANRVGGAPVEVGQQAGSWPMVLSIGNRLSRACSNKSARVVPTAPVQGLRPGPSGRSLPNVGAIRQPDLNPATRPSPKPFWHSMLRWCGAGLFRCPGMSLARHRCRNRDLLDTSVGVGIPAFGLLRCVRSRCLTMLSRRRYCRLPRLLEQK